MSRRNSHPLSQGGNQTSSRASGSQPPASRSGSRNSGQPKAVYRPLVSSQSHRSHKPSRSGPSRHSRMQGQPNVNHPVHGLDPILEGTDTAVTLDGTALSHNRDDYELPQDPYLRSAVTAINQYLEETGLEDLFQSLCQLLLSLTDLPYNPYPGFVRRLGARAEWFHMNIKSKEEILQILGGKVEETHIAYITHPVACDFVWGLSSLTCAVSPAELRLYKWLLQDVTPDPARLNSMNLYSVQVMTALVGTSVFHGTFFPAPPSIDIRLEFLITGHDVSEAINLFAESVIKDIQHMERKGSHALLGVHIPLVADKAVLNRGVSQDLWTLDKILDRKGEFCQAVSNAVASNILVYAQYLFCLAADVEVYRRGEKQYGLNFVQVIEDMSQEESLSSFTDLPMSTLHEGIFMNRTHAEAYLGTFTPREDILDKDGQRARGTKPSLWDEEDATSIPGTPSSFQQTPVSEVPQKDNKVRIDGFRLGMWQGFGPDAWQVTTPIKNHLQRIIVSSHLTDNLMDIVFSVLKLVLMDRSSYNDGLIVELYRAAHSTAAHFHSLRLLNQGLRDLVTKYEGNAESKVVTEVYAQFRQGLKDLLNSDLQDRGSQLGTAARALDNRLETLTQSQEGFSQTLPLTKKTVQQLNDIDAYCLSVSLGLAKEVLANSPKLRELIGTLEDTFPEDIMRPQTQARDRKDNQRTNARAGEGEILYRHGAENELILKHDRQVINVEMCEERDSAPTVVSTENVLIKYIMDTHLDEVWPQFLLDLMSGVRLPPNPFPHMVTFFRKCTMKMDLYGEPDDVICQRVLHGGAREEDHANHIWHIPGCDAHGLCSALLAIDSSQFFKVAPATQQLIQTDFIQRRGPYRLAICSALTGHSPLYGEMAPYITDLELHEHCYVRGPDGCALEGLQVYSKVVYEHIKGLKKHYPLPVSGIYFGDAQTRWSVEEMILHKRAFASEFERHVGNKEPVIIKSFILLDWRYVPVTKHFKYHFINEDETVMEEFFTSNPAALYQNVFFDVEKAAFHFQYGGTPNRSSPYNSSNLRVTSQYVDRQVLAAARRQDWLSVHRWLLTKDLIHQDNTHVAECWKMLHSIAGQVEYVIALGNSLSELVKYSLDLKEKLDIEPAKNEETKPDEKTTDQESLGKLDFAVMAQMTMAYRQKAESVCFQHVALSGRTVGEVIQARLQSIMERDQVTRELHLKLELRTLEVLTEVHNMLQFIQDSTSYDVHCTCPASQASLHSIRVEFHDRPASVASVYLNDPSEYEIRPTACLSDHVDEWIRP